MTPVRGEMIRTVQTIQIGTALDMRRRAERDAELDMQEIDLQYQLPISGTAGDETSEWGTVEIDFEWEFHYAPANRDSDLAWPHFSFGAYVPAPVGILARVSGWKVDTDTDAVVGALVAVLALGDGAYEGVLHVTFQGWGMSRDDFSDTPDLETGVDTS